MPNKSVGQTEQVAGKQHRHQTHTENAIELIHAHEEGEHTHSHVTENGVLEWTNIIMTEEELAAEQDSTDGT